MKKLFPILLSTAIIFAGCAVKKEVHRSAEHEIATVQAAGIDSCIYHTQTRTTSGMQIRIEEKTVERDTLGRPLRETTRRYFIEQCDSIVEESASQRIGKHTVSSRTQTDRSNEDTVTKKPAIGRSIPWVLGIAGAGVAAWWVLKKIRP